MRGPRATIREQAEALRRDARFWKLGIVYVCRADPRLFVRTRHGLGWAWNFGHRTVWPALLAVLLVTLGPPALLVRGGAATLGPVLGAFLVGLALVVVVAHHVASGPR